MNSSLLPVFVITLEAALRGWLGPRKTRHVPPWRGNGQDTGQVTLAVELWSRLAVLEVRGWCCLIFQTFPSWKARRLCQQLFRLPCFLCFSHESEQGDGVALAGEKWHGDQSWLDEMQIHFLFPSLKSPSQHSSLLTTPNGFARFQSQALSQIVVFFLCHSLHSF